MRVIFDWYLVPDIPVYSYYLKFLSQESIDMPRKAGVTGQPAFWTIRWPQVIMSSRKIDHIIIISFILSDIMAAYPDEILYNGKLTDQC